MEHNDQKHLKMSGRSEFFRGAGMMIAGKPWQMSEQVSEKHIQTLSASTEMLEHGTRNEHRSP
jgi:hypothetical protein